MTTRGKSRLINRNFTHRGVRTSLRLEPEFWTALDYACAQYGTSRGWVIETAGASYKGPLTSAVRTWLLVEMAGKPEIFRAAAA